MLKQDCVDINFIESTVYMETKFRNYKTFSYDGIEDSKNFDKYNRLKTAEDFLGGFIIYFEKVSNRFSATDQSIAVKKSVTYCFLPLGW